MEGFVIKKQKHYLELIGPRFFINKYRDIIICPYSIDLTSRQIIIKARLWAKYGSAKESSLTLEELKDYEAISADYFSENNKNLDEKEARRIFDCYKNEPIDKDIIETTKQALRGLTIGSILEIKYSEYGLFKYLLMYDMSAKRYRLVGLQDELNTDYNRENKIPEIKVFFKNPNQIADYLVGKVIDKEINKIRII